jgi:FAD/FMN-containing dehydrogenase/DNA-binding HxlR family transcriptional regulator
VNFADMPGSQSLLEVAVAGVDTGRVRSYGQFCPIARGSEVLAERWTPIILRNVLMGCRTFNEIAAGAPGLSRALLTRRLRELERAGVIQTRPKLGGRGSWYEPSAQGLEMWEVLRALGGWAERWIDVAPEHAEPDVVLWSWCESFLRREALPDRRVVVRFEFTGRTGRRTRIWFLIEGGEAEICGFDPGFGDDLVVRIQDPLVFARWHLGLVEWASAVRDGAVDVEGPRHLRRALPTWNAGPQAHVRVRAEHDRIPSALSLSQPAAPGSGPGAVSGAGRRRPRIAGFDGDLVVPGDSCYDSARAVWNGAIDRRPRFIARCRTVSDVVASLRFGRERGLPIAVRGGGHGVAGTALCDDGLVIDLTAMKTITVDPAARTATAQGGVRWGELDTTTQAFGLATTGGTMSRTGIAGLTLGGGIGWLMRRHGLTADNLVAAEIVTVDADHLVTSEAEHPDRFWGLRGGGGGLGVVTSFTYRLHPVGPEVLGGLVLWPLEDGPDVLGAYRDFTATAAPEVASAVALRRAPAAPFLPPALHGRPICAVAMVALGEAAVAERLLAPMRTFGRPLIDLVRRRPYTNMQSLLDAGNPDGWHYYWKSTGLAVLDVDVIETMVEHAAAAHSPDSYAVLFHLGGAVADIDPDATAYSRRHVPFELNINAVSRADQPGGADERAWARSFVEALAPHADGVYLNFVDHDDQHRVAGAFSSAAHQRLVRLRRRYDPDMVFASRLESPPPTTR